MCHPCGRVPKLDRARFEAISRLHVRTLRRVLARRGVPEADLDDMVQESFLVLHARLTEISVGAEWPYLLAVARRVAANNRRRHRRRARALERYVHEFSDDSKEVEQEARASWLDSRTLVEAALARVRPPFREILILVELGELTMAEAAEALKLPKGTVASRLKRARHALERSLKRTRSAESPLARDYL